MPEGTTVNMFMARMHRGNAQGILEESDDDMRFAERTLIAMAATAPGAKCAEDEPWYEHVARRVPELLETYAEAYLARRAASIVVHEPDQCHDDYDAAVTVPAIAHEGGTDVGCV